jgi:hypothetical protein
MSRVLFGVTIVGALIGLGVSARADVVMDWNHLAAVISEAEGMATSEPSSKWSPKEDAEEMVPTLS